MFEKVIYNSSPFDNYWIWRELIPAANINQTIAMQKFKSSGVWVS